MLCSAWSITSDASEIVGSPVAMFKQASCVPRKFDGENIAAHFDEVIELQRGLGERLALGWRQLR
jgi:hypothetical protein